MGDFENLYTELMDNCNLINTIPQSQSVPKWKYQTTTTTNPMWKTHTDVWMDNAQIYPYQKDIMDQLKNFKWDDNLGMLQTVSTIRSEYMKRLANFIDSLDDDLKKHEKWLKEYKSPVMMSTRQMMIIARKGKVGLVEVQLENSLSPLEELNVLQQLDITHQDVNVIVSIAEEDPKGANKILKAIAETGVTVKKIDDKNKPTIAFGFVDPETKNIDSDNSKHLDIPFFCWLLKNGENIASGV